MIRGCQASPGCCCCFLHRLCILCICKGFLSAPNWQAPFVSGRYAICGINKYYLFALIDCAWAAAPKAMAKQSVGAKLQLTSLPHFEPSGKKKTQNWQIASVHLRHATSNCDATISVAAKTDSLQRVYYWHLGSIILSEAMISSSSKGKKLWYGRIPFNKLQGKNTYFKHRNVIRMALNIFMLNNIHVYHHNICIKHTFNCFPCSLRMYLSL